MAIPGRATGYDMTAWVLTGLALLLVFPLHLFSALMAGLLVHELVHLAAPLLRITRMSRGRAKLVVVGLLAALIVTVLALLSWKSAAYLRSQDADIPGLLGKMADILEGVRARLPAWAMMGLQDASVEDVNRGLAAMLRTHAATVQEAGKGVGLTLAHVLVGMVLGAIVALRTEVMEGGYRPLAASLAERVRRIARAFRAVVFAQVRISALNTFLTFLYLVVALPAAGVRLPLVKTMVALTFLAGLLPVVGNLISNTIIVVVSLSVSFPVAVWSLGFLVVVHKLEYFMNARIVGGHINAKTWEILLAMVAMEAAFGIAGVVAAPIYYAYLKQELVDRGLV